MWWKPVDVEIDQIKSLNSLPFVYSFYKATNHYLIAKSYLFNSVKETCGLYYNKIKPPGYNDLVCQHLY